MGAHWDRFNPNKGIKMCLLHFVFILGSKPGMLDYSIWPWLERMQALSQIYGNSLEMAKEKYPNMVRLFIES